nr:transcription factor DYT1 [Tanacetum cinerariifolium]
MEFPNLYEDVSSSMVEETHGSLGRLNKETIIIDAIDYIQELKISVEDLTREIYAMEEEMANEQSFEIIQIRPEEKMKKWGIESEVAVTHIDENKLVLVATQVQGVIADIIKAI